MLFRKDVLEGIGNREITVAFRRWKRPTVRQGGTLMTTVGQLDILLVERVTEDRISLEDAVAAGYGDCGQLIAELNRYPAGDLYRIVFVLARPDPRIVLRADDRLTAQDLAGLEQKLDKMDSSGRYGAWTRSVLSVLAGQPGRRAGDLAAELGYEKDWLKQHVRKLKALGLTVSLGTGYELSPRGRAYLETLL